MNERNKPAINVRIIYNAVINSLKLNPKWACSFRFEFADWRADDDEQKIGI